jgi:hypothetical protein
LDGEGLSSPPHPLPAVVAHPFGRTASADWVHVGVVAVLRVFGFELVLGAVAIRLCDLDLARADVLENARQLEDDEEEQREAHDSDSKIHADHILSIGVPFGFPKSHQQYKLRINYLQFSIIIT